MAQFYTDFSEYTTGVQPSDWTKRWVTANLTASVVEDAGATGGKLLEATVSTAARCLLTWDAVGTVADTEVLMRVSPGVKPSSAAVVTCHAARAAGSAAAETGYHPSISTDGSGAGLTQTFRFVNGTYGLLSGVAKEYVAGTFYWFRAQVSGTTIQHRRWSGALGDEPASWDRTHTDSDITAAGWVGWLNVAVGTHHLDVFAVGTAGDAAPTEPVGATTFTLSTSVVGEGSITLDPAGGTYDENTVVAASAVPATGWTFDSWSGDLAGATNPQNVTMDADKSITATFTEDAAPPAAPTGLTATAGDSQVALAWSASAGADGHRVYRNTTDNFGTATQVGADLGAAADSYTDTTVTNDTEYFYWITAFNSEGESDPSGVASATPAEPPPPPPGRARLVLQRRVAGAWTP